ncbi:MAG: glycerate kinase [Deltaproteobacteria bacterium]|nr:glycerate kinase [Deltaproteobacteria bacterium]
MARDLLSMKQDARRIFAHALSAVDPAAAVKRVVRVEGTELVVAGHRYDLSKIDRVYVIGAGKASASMAGALEELMGERIADGAVTVKYGYAASLRKIMITEAGHPVPDQNGVAGSLRIVEILKRAGEKDLVIGLISGGGSALTPLPAEGITLEDKEALTRLLLGCGATIDEFNTIRKHLSRIKGGNMARLAFPATLVNLMLSDVIGDPVDVIASGPCVPDRSTFQDCERIIEKYHLREKLPPSVATRFRLGVEGKIPETPKPGDPVFEKVQNVIIGNNRVAVQGAEAKARELGYQTLILSTSIKGETREVAGVHAAIAREMHASGNPVGLPACVISGGETTVTIQGTGLGGRNQEFALAAALEIEGIDHVVILSGGTDGTDGPTDAAGAVADETTVSRARALGIDPQAYLDDNDSYHFFERLGDLLLTGPTNTNVMDVRIILADTPTEDET